MLATYAASLAGVLSLAGVVNDGTCRAAGLLQPAQPRSLPAAASTSTRTGTLPRDPVSVLFHGTADGGLGFWCAGSSKRR